MSAITAETLTEWRQRAEFWTTRHPSVIGHLYDRNAVAFAGEVLALVDALSEARGAAARVEALADEWEHEADTQMQWRGRSYAARLRAALAGEDA